VDPHDAGLLAMSITASIHAHNGAGKNAGDAIEVVDDIPSLPETKKSGCFSRVDSVQWWRNDNWPKLRDALVMARNLGACRDIATEVPRSTLYRFHQKLKGKEVTFQNCFEHQKFGLLTGEDLGFLQDCIIARDRASNGMTRKEIISIISTIAMCCPKKAKRYYNYCLEKELLPRLARKGRVRKAQPTSTKRLQVTTESQERWHNLVSSMWEEQMRRNGNIAEIFACVITLWEM